MIRIACYTVAILALLFFGLELRDVVITTLVIAFTDGFVDGIEKETSKARARKQLEG